MDETKGKSNMLKFGSTVLATLLILFASCASNVPATNSASATTASYSTPEQKNPTPTADASDPETVEARLTDLFDLCRRDDLEAAAAYFVYRGPDKSREWKDVLNSRDSEERSAVESICQRIKGYLDESDGYQFGAVKVEREREGEWHALEVSFQRGDKVKKAIFAFLLIKGQFSIGDID